MLCFKLSERFVRSGFEVDRVKIESTYSNPGIPETEDEVSLACCNKTLRRLDWLAPDVQDTAANLLA